MPDFFAEEIINQTAALTKEDSHHALRVLRLAPGQTIRVSVNARRYEATLEVDNQTAIARITKEIPSSEARTHHPVSGWPKGDKMDQIVRQATELGVHAVVPCLFARCVARPEQAHKRLERLNKIAREAAMQSGRTMIPVVEDVLDVDGLRKRLALPEQALVPYELAQGATINSVRRRGTSPW